MSEPREAPMKEELMGRDPGGEAGDPVPWRRSDVRVLIVEHGAILREGFRRLVDDAPGLQVVDTASDPEAALRALRTLRPDIVLIDARLPNQRGFFLTRATRRESPSARVIVVSDAVDQALLARAAEAGAAALIVERIGADDLGSVLRTVGGDSIEFLGHIVGKAG